MTDSTHTYNTLRGKVYWWLERPVRHANGPRFLELALIIFITLNVTAVILETVDSLYLRWQPYKRDGFRARSHR